jgi:hypothetical protein
MVVTQSTNGWISDRQAHLPEQSMGSGAVLHVVGVGCSATRAETA